MRPREASGAAVERGQARLSPAWHFWLWAAVPLGALAGVLVALALVIVIEPRYTAETIVAPATATASRAALQQSGLSSGLATPLVLPHHDLPTDFMSARQSLTARRTVDRLLAALEADGFRVPDEPVWMRSVGRWVSRLTGGRAVNGDDATRLRRHLERTLDVEFLDAANLWRLRYRSTDRAFAEAVLGHVVAIADDRRRESVVADWQAHRSALTLRATQEPDQVTRADFSVMARQLAIMLAMAEQADSFALERIEPVSVSRTPDWPDAERALPMGLLLGGLAGFGLVLIVAVFALPASGRGDTLEVP